MESWQRGHLIKGNPLPSTLQKLARYELVDEA